MVEGQAVDRGLDLARRTLGDHEVTRVAAPLEGTGVDAAIVGVVAAQAPPLVQAAPCTASVEIFIPSLSITSFAQ